MMNHRRRPFNSLSLTAASIRLYDAFMMDKRFSAAEKFTAESLTETPVEQEATDETPPSQSPNSAAHRAVVAHANGNHATEEIAAEDVTQDRAPRLAPPPPSPQPQSPPKSILREYFESAVVTIIMALYGMTFIVQAVKVPTGSMQNTILVGDHLLVNKFIFAPGPHMPFLPQREIKRGDIIVFKYPGNKENPSGDINSDSPPFITNYVKRVIGLPGDHIEVRGARVFINGEPLPERRLAAIEENARAPLIVSSDSARGDGAYTVFYSQTPLQTSRAFDDFGEVTSVTVPPQNYFVMGDNRDNSSDSRVWGFVPRDLVIGRAMFVYWSYDESADTTGSFLTNFLQHTRWSRTGTMIK